MTHNTASARGKKNTLRSTVAALAHPAILGALVHEDEGERHATIDIWFRAGTELGAQTQGRQAALVAVLRSLGPQWSALVSEEEPFGLFEGTDLDPQEPFLRAS